MAKMEESKLDKIKSFLGIKGKGGSSQLTGSRPQSREFIITPDIIKDISPETSSNHRLKSIRELCEVVQTKRLEENAVEVLWASIEDLLRPQVPVENRHLGLRFLQCLIKGQYEHLGIMRCHFFSVVKRHTLFEDLDHRMDLFIILSSDGRDLEYFEEESGAFLLEWMKEIMSSNKVVDFLSLLVNVIKFNAAYLDNEIIAGLVLNTCLVATKTRKEEDIELCLKVLDTVVCYSYLPPASVYHFTVCLCRIVGVERLCQLTWMLMKKFLGTHLGHSAIHTMCCILQDKNNTTESGCILLRGAIFFIGMALWGSQKISSLIYPPAAVLPSFLQALVFSNTGMVAYEVVLSIQRLVNKYGKDEQIVTWDLLLDIVEALLKQVECNPSADALLISNIHDLLTAIETLHEQGQFNGSTERFFSIIETCANKRPESSILVLVSHKAQAIHLARDNWIPSLNHLTEKYFKQEARPRIRIKVLDILSYTISSNRQLYEDDLIDLVVIPCLAHVENEADCQVKKRACQLLVDLAMTCQSARCTDIIELINKVISQPLSISTPPSPGSSSTLTTAEKHRRFEQDKVDITTAVIGLVNIFKKKLFELPSSFAIRSYEMLLEHLEGHYSCGHMLLQAGKIREAIFDCFMNLRADPLYRMGLPDANKNHQLSFSPYVLCYSCEDSDEASGSGSSAATPIKTTTLQYAEAFKCIRICVNQERDWNVLKLVLDRLPMLLQNKTLLLSAHSQDIDCITSSLCAMVSDRTTNLPGNLLNAPANFSKSDFHSHIFNVLICLVSFHNRLDKVKQEKLLRCLEFGLVSKCALTCVRALTVCSLEIQDVMMRQLPQVLLKLSRISATVAMAIPLMEFLSGLIHLPQLYANFVEDQYMSVFAIALPYTNPFKYSHYAVSLAYHVIAMWFLKCRLSFRKGFVAFIAKGLRANVLRQFEETNSFRQRQNEDSSNRARTQSLNDETRRMLELDTVDELEPSRTRAAAAMAAARTKSEAQQGSTMSTFHRELTETCVDMMARFSFSTCSSMPRRTPVANFLLEGGQTQSWLLGNRIVTITTSGGAKVGRAGLCDRCLNLARVATKKSEESKCSSEQTEPVASGRRRHKSAAVRTLTESVQMKPLSVDDIQLYRPSSHESLDGAGKLQDKKLSQEDLTRDRSKENAASLETRDEKIEAVDSVLMGLQAKPSDASIFSPHICNCWCTQWAEIHIRRPTGNLSWMMRIQNDQDITEAFPDFLLADISNLFMSVDKSSPSPLNRKKIDSTSLCDDEYENLLQEHFQEETAGSLRASGSKSKTSPLKFCDDVISQREAEKPTLQNPSEDDLKAELLRKSLSSPELSPLDQQRLVTGVGTQDLQAVYDRSRDIKTTNHVQRDDLTVTESKIEYEEQTTSRISDDKLQAKPVRSPEQKRDQEEKKVVSRQLTMSTIDEEVGMWSKSDTSISSGSSGRHKRPLSLETDGRLSFSALAGKDSSHGGLSPSFLFLQFYHSHVFSVGEERPLALPQNEVVNRAVKLLDLIFPYETHKIGVVYVGPGQTENETAILSNVYGSSRYMQFLQGLGHLKRLSDCSPDSVYVGGLDLNGNDGQFTYAWHEEFIQVVFHVATLMPNKESDKNCNAKKLHIGNDYVSIVYNNSCDDYKIGTIKGQFNYVNIVVQPLDHGSNAVTVETKPDITEIIGHTDTKIISDSNLPILVRQMAVHANLASTILQKQKSNPRDPYASNWLERLRQIKRIRLKVYESSKGDISPPGSPLPEDFTDFVK